MAKDNALNERQRRLHAESVKREKAARATEVVEKMFDKDVCRATGRTLEGAAPWFSKRCVVERVFVFTSPIHP